MELPFHNKKASARESDMMPILFISYICEAPFAFKPCQNSKNCQK